MFSLFTSLQCLYAVYVKLKFHAIRRAFQRVMMNPLFWSLPTARAHDREGAARDARWHVYPEQAAAGLWTTSTDLARFVVEVQQSAIGESNRVLCRTRVREMLAPAGVGDFAVGFQISRIGQGWYFQHGGSNWGFRSLIIGYMTKGYGLAVMTNADQGSPVANEILRRIQKVYEWDSVAEPVLRGY